MSQVREKKTQVDKTLPPVSELVADREYTMVNRIDLDGNASQIDYRELAAADPHPNPMPVDREGYGSIDTTHYQWASGHSDWLNVRDAVDRYHTGPQRESKFRLLDFGCATGRFMRHAWAFGRDRYDVWGCDFAPANIEWGKRHLTPEMKFILNTSLAHLPFPDGYFDVVTAFSVFTHIDLFEDAWLLELRRITSRDGVLYLTVQNDDTWNVILERPWSLEHLKVANKFEGNMKITDDIFQRPMPQDRIVLKMSADKTYDRNVWVSNKHIREIWGRYFDVVHIAPLAHGRYQTPVILKWKED